MEKNSLIESSSNCYDRIATKTNLKRIIKQNISLYLLLDGSDDPLIAQDYLNKKIEEMDTNHPDNILDFQKKKIYQNLLQSFLCKKESDDYYGETLYDNTAAEPR
jgi:hypothetical protein